MTVKLPFERAEIEGSIIARWRRVVHHFPQQIAVTTVSGEQYSYAELDQASNRLAHALLAELGTVNCPIILLLEHSYALLVSILGTLKANKAYVAFDPTQSVGQLQLLRETTAAPLIVTDREHHALAQAIAKPNDEMLEEQASLSQTEIWCIESLPATDLGCSDITISPDSIAGIFFTSGTIKRAKGVPRTHRIILHRVWFSTSINHFAPGHGISGIRQCGLGAGVADVFNALLNGATYCIYTLRRHGLHGLSDWLQSQKMTYFHPPIVLFRSWLDTLSPDAFFPHLRQILPSGHKSRTDIERLWQHVSETCVVLTSYSSTETTQITCSVLNRSTSLAEGVLHVGWPLPDKFVMVVKEDGQIAEVGEVGEIVVRSRYISSGYWQQPALTAQRFSVADDGSGEISYRTGDIGRWRADGSLELLGRRDSQIKLRGYRVVLGELEDALRALPSIKEAVVTADEERGLMYAYAIAAIDPPEPAPTIRATLAKRLPDYLLPTHLIYLPHFPLLASGKVNRQALPVPAESRPLLATPYQPPRDAFEKQLVGLWKEILQIEEIGIHDNFFELGGHSLLAMRLMMEIEKKWENTPSLVGFFSQPTIAHLALMLISEGNRASEERGADSDIFERLALPLTPAQIGYVRSIYEQLKNPDAPQRWRQPAFLRWHRRRKAIRYLTQLLPYRLSYKLIALMIQNQSIRQKFFKTEEELIQQFLSTIDTPHHDEQTIAASLLCSTLHYYQIGPKKAKQAISPSSGGWLSVSGSQLLKQVQDSSGEEKRGLILVRSHEVTSSYFNLLQLFPNTVESFRVGQIQNHIPSFQFDDKVVENALYAHQLNSARKVLQKGGMINITADGFHGASEGIEVNFHGRRRPFYTSFAELALLTDAQVLVVMTSIPKPLAGEGSVHLKFIGPLDAGDDTMPHNERVERLTSQYITLLSQMWSTMPWMMPWYQMQKHLSYPPTFS